MSKLQIAFTIFLFILVLPIKTNGVNSSKTRINIQLDEILNSATEIANYMEFKRLIPNAIVLSDSSMNPAQLITIFAKTIELLELNQNVEFDEIPNISSPLEFYPTITLEDSLYEKAIEKENYLLFCSDIIQLSQSEEIMPNTFTFLGGEIRFPETLHFLSSILRFYKFFGYLPKVNEIMIISPKGLVPWDTPIGYDKYTSMINSWLPYNFIRYNYYTVGKYKMFKLAKEIVGPESDYIEAGREIYDWVKHWWGQSGYYIYQRTFGSRMSAEEHLRHNLQNSAFHFQDMNGLFRSLGIPCTEHVLFDRNNHKWINTDVHAAYGNEAEAPQEPPWDFKSLPSEDDKMIQKIRNVMSYSGTNEAELKSVWINPKDISEYGVDFVVDMVKSGGFDAIILTVKTELGNLYYPTTEFIDRFEFDALTPLIEKASQQNINVYPAISVLADRYTLEDNMDWRNMEEENPDPDYFYPNISVSPCVSEYRNIIISMLKELSQINNIKGIVLAHLYWDTGSYKDKMGGNPECEDCQTHEGWQEDLLQEYAAMLVDSIKARELELEVIIATHPVTTGYQPDFYGHENKVKMSEVSDAIIISYDGNFWLTDYEDWTYGSPQSPVPFDFETYISNYALQISKPVIVSQNVTDEWEFPSLFYSGFLGFVKDLSADGINLHSPTSMLGENGVTFTNTQYQKISKIDFSRSYSAISIPDVNEDKFQSFELYPNCPNPFNTSTIIKYQVLVPSNISLKIFNLLGQEIVTLVQEIQKKGTYEIRWNGNDKRGNKVASGIYIFRITTNNSAKTGKMVLLR